MQTRKDHGESAERPREVVVLGSTGSVGTQALDVIERNPALFRVRGLAAGGGNVESLAGQALRFGVDVVAVSRASAAQELQLAFYKVAKERGYSSGGYALPKILAGPHSVAEMARWPCDVVLNAVDGSLGLAATLAALEAGHTLALANKESLIAGGPLVRRAAAPEQIVPVDSEHSALAQCLRGGDHDEVRRLVLTASGGPFRGWSREDLTEVGPEQALAHPTWSMGPLVTVNSATLVNKGLEVVEAHLLFGIPLERIEVVVHPQSVIHSMVEFTDGSTLAQASPPDMRLPIALALGWPRRVPEAAPGVDWTAAHTWDFLPLDNEAFPAVELARQVARTGATAPAVFNAANEECVHTFLRGEVSFPEIMDTVTRVVSEHEPDTVPPATVDDVMAADGWARARARELCTH